MRLTSNEKKVLSLLLGNARISDSSISTKLKISSQAVGKIRRKLESTIIDSYSVNLDYARMGVHAFALTLSRLTSEGLDMGELEVEKKVNSVPEIIQVYRLPNSSYTHVLLYGFSSLDNLDSFFHSGKMFEDLFRYLENRELFVFSHNSLIKDDPSGLFNQIVEGMNNFSNKKSFEIEKFKRRINDVKDY